MQQLQSIDPEFLLSLPPNNAFVFKESLSNIGTSFSRREPKSRTSMDIFESTVEQRNI